MMRKIVPFITLVIVYTSSVLGNMPCDTTKNAIKAIYSKSNLLYSGIDNLLQVTHCGYNSETSVIRCNNGQAFIDSSDIIVIPQRSGFMDVIIDDIIGQDTINLISARFYVTNLPVPVIIFCNYESTRLHKITKSFLLGCDSIYVKFNDDISDNQSWATIDHMEFGYQYGGNYMTYRNDGNKFSEEVRNIIARLAPGRDIFIRVFLKYEGNVIKSMPVFRSVLY